MPLISKSNTQWIWELTSAADLIIFLNEFKLKLQGKALLLCETYTVVKLFVQLVLFESQVMSIHFMYFSCNANLKWKPTSPFLHKFGNIFQAPAAPAAAACYFGPWGSTKEISIFQNPFNCVTEELQPVL